MTVEQIRKLTAATEEALRVGDLATLKQIYKLTQRELQEDDPSGGEWFVSLLPAEVYDEISK